MDIKYFTEWSECTEIEWWNEGRRKLNAIIRMVNKWSIDGCPAKRAERILRHIDMGEQTFAATDGGSGWLKELREMRAYVKSKVVRTP